MQRQVLRVSRLRGEQPHRDAVQEVLAGSGAGRADRYLGRPAQAWDWFRVAKPRPGGW
jgi:hypothetical protein